MESNSTEQWWNLWSAAKTWEWLPPTQQLRHRRGGAAIFLGDGMTNIKYSLIHHDNMDLKPTWKLYLGTCFSFARGKTGSLLSAMTFFCVQHCLCRYIARDGCAIVVRPVGSPEGVKVFKFEWDRPSKAVKVLQAFNGDHVASLPGKWGPTKKFVQADGGRAGFPADAKCQCFFNLFVRQRFFFLYRLAGCSCFLKQEIACVRFQKR